MHCLAEDWPPHLATHTYIHTHIPSHKKPTAEEQQFKVSFPINMTEHERKWQNQSRINHIIMGDYCRVRRKRLRSEIRSCRYSRKICNWPIINIKVVHNRKGNDVLHLHISKKIMIFIAILAPYMAMCLTFYLWKEGLQNKKACLSNEFNKGTATTSSIGECGRAKSKQQQNNRRKSRTLSWARMKTSLLGQFSST